MTTCPNGYAWIHIKHYSLNLSNVIVTVCLKWDTPLNVFIVVVILVLEWLHNDPVLLLQQAQSNEPGEQLLAVQHARKMLSKDKNPPINDLIK